LRVVVVAVLEQIQQIFVAVAGEVLEVTGIFPHNR
jgi:hypothetical protein